MSEAQSIIAGPPRAVIPDLPAIKARGCGSLRSTATGNEIATFHVRDCNCRVLMPRRLANPFQGREAAVARLDATEARLLVIRAANDAAATEFATACEPMDGGDGPRTVKPNSAIYTSANNFSKGEDE